MRDTLLFRSEAARGSSRKIAATDKYRPDIDGLRAVAVLSVMLYHVAPGAITGGWVGVDVFFVISGFLITRLIKEQLEAGTFSFSTFYARRARRLFASFFVTILLTSVAARLIFDHGYLQHYAGEVVYAVAAVSNFYYWLDGGYFGIAEQYKPLLHTWSLGVEEQFYLIWPLTLFLTYRYCRRYLWVVLGTAFLVSLGLAEYYIAAGKENPTFFLLHSRIFEFSIGAMLVWLVEEQPGYRRLKDFALILGLGLILIAVSLFTIGTPFPTVYALVPCGGAGLVIFAGADSRLTGILANRLMVGIGKISYSLYLVHWPLIVFYKYHRLAPLTHLEQAGICATAILCAVLMYRFVEQPFRNPARVRFQSKAALGLTCAAATFALLVPATVYWAKGAFFWGGPVLYVDEGMLQQVEEPSKQARVDAQITYNTFTSTDNRRKVMVAGDSHSKDVAAALLLGFGGDRYEFARTDFDDPCFSADETEPWILRLSGTKTVCGAQIEALKQSPGIAAADSVLIANYWSLETLKGFNKGVALLKRLTKAKIIVVGQNAVFPTFDTSLRFLGPAQLRSLNSLFYRQQSEVDLWINEELKRLAANNGLEFIDRQPLVCSMAASQCQVYLGNGNFLYRDPTHWSYMGRELFGGLIARRYGEEIFSASGH